MDEPYQIKFVNNSGLPIIVETWHNKCFSLSVMKSEHINDGQEIMLTSITGEWYLDCMFDNSIDRQKWLDQGYSYYNIGKFRSIPSYNGLQSWIDVKDFDVKIINGDAYFVKL